LIAQIHQVRGREQDALGAVEAALERPEQLEDAFYDAELLRLKGELRTRSDEAEAESLFLRALEVTRNQGCRWFELRVATNLARLWHRQARDDDACELLRPIYDWFSQGFDRPDLRDANALLQELA
jgi:predicted ATPase